MLFSVLSCLQLQLRGTNRGIPSYKQRASKDPPALSGALSDEHKGLMGDEPGRAELSQGLTDSQHTVRLKRNHHILGEVALEVCWLLC